MRGVRYDRVIMGRRGRSLNIHEFSAKLLSYSVEVLVNNDIDENVFVEEPGLKRLFLGRIDLQVTFYRNTLRIYFRD